MTDGKDVFNEMLRKKKECCVMCRESLNDNYCCLPECKCHNNTKEWGKDLRETLTEQLHVMDDLCAAMPPGSREEFIAVALPNLHITMHEFIRTTFISRSEIRRVIETMRNNYSLEEDREVYNDILEQLLPNDKEI